MRVDDYQRRMFLCIFTGMFLGCAITLGLLPYLDQTKELYSIFVHATEQMTEKGSMENLFHIGRKRIEEWAILFLILLTKISFPGFCLYLCYAVTCLTSLFCVGITELGVRGIFAFLCLQMPQLFFYVLSFIFVSKLFHQKITPWERYRKQLIPGSFASYVVGILCEVYLNPTLISWITIK